MKSNPSPSFYLKKVKKRKEQGCVSAGIEPDNFAGLTDFIIPPQIW
jgi:hypothetical protein